MHCLFVVDGLECFVFKSLSQFSIVFAKMGLGLLMNSDEFWNLDEFWWIYRSEFCTFLCAWPRRWGCVSKHGCATGGTICSNVPICFPIAGIERTHYWKLAWFCKGMLVNFVHSSMFISLQTCARPMRKLQRTLNKSDRASFQQRFQRRQDRRGQKKDTTVFA